ncbi:MAG: TetR/AcrR family transcriptional regulator [Solirubrobacterales bacterium]|nr:TetR/AcrR family transcriptional regulator [Solirubrobacterales bacterium]
MSTDERRVRLRRQRGETRGTIVEAAEKLLSERSFREVSVDEVMQAAGFARTIFYRHFDDLSDLMLKTTAGAFEDLLAAHERVVEIAAIDEASLRAAIRPAVDTFVRHGPLVRAISEAASHDADIERAYSALQDRYVEMTARLLRRAQAAGARIADPGQTARALTLMNVAYLVDAFGREPKISADEALQTIVEVWLVVVP